MKTRVFIVDDEEQFVESLAERLRIRDYDVTTSYNGEDAVDKVRQHQYDVVILDVMMPGMDGLETLREIKKLRPSTEIIMLTGHATVETAIDGMKLGALDFLLKPYKFEDLFTKIKKAHERKVEKEERLRKAEARKIISSPGSVLKE